LRALALTDYDAALTLQARTRPEPRDGETLIEVRAVGLCGTDVKLCAGKLGDGVSLPLVPGHEIAGDVVAGGDLPRGTRVACYIYAFCGRCERCRAGETSLCASAARLGIERDGGLADYVAVPSQCLIPFGDSLDYADAAVAMDSVAAPWAALHGAGEMWPGERVVVIGAGGLGQSAIQLAVAGGARVAAVDVARHALDCALQLGAEVVTEPRDLSPLRQWAPGGADLVLELSGRPAGFRAALSLLRPRGRLVVCGYPATRASTRRARRCVRSKWVTSGR
jgi:propanol-preferring alcohol dehydrogenase